MPRPKVYRNKPPKVEVSPDAEEVQAAPKKKRRTKKDA